MVVFEKKKKNNMTSANVRNCLAFISTHINGFPTFMLSRLFSVYTYSITQFSLHMPWWHIFPKFIIFFTFFSFTCRLCLESRLSITLMTNNDNSRNYLLSLSTHKGTRPKRGKITSNAYAYIYVRIIYIHIYIYVYIYILRYQGHAQR